MTDHTLPAIFTSLALCDAKLEHEHMLITDGSHAYAYSTGPHGEDAVGVAIDGHLASVDCNRTDLRNGEPCTGRVEWRLDEEWSWLHNDGNQRGVYAAAASVLARSGTLADR